MVLRPLGHLQPLGLRSALGHSVQRSLKPPALLSPVVRSPLFIPLESGVNRWSDKAIEESSETEHLQPESNIQSDETPLVQEPIAQALESNDSEFSHSAVSDKPSKSDSELSLQLIQTDAISDQLVDSEEIQPSQNETASTPSSQKNLVNEEQLQRSREALESQDDFPELPILEFSTVQKRELEQLQEVEGEPQSAFRNDEANPLQEETQAEIPTIALQKSELTEQSPIDISPQETEDEPRSIQTKPIARLQQSELGTSLELTSAEFSEDTLVNPIQRMTDDLQVGDRELEDSRLTEDSYPNQVDAPKQAIVSPQHLDLQVNDPSVTSELHSAPSVLPSQETQTPESTPIDFVASNSQPDREHFLAETVVPLNSSTEIQAYSENHSELSPVPKTPQPPSPQSIEVTSSQLSPFDSAVSQLEPGEPTPIQTSIDTQNQQSTLLFSSKSQPQSIRPASESLEIADSNRQLNDPQIVARSQSSEQFDNVQSEQLSSSPLEMNEGDHQPDHSQIVSRFQNSERPDDVEFKTSYISDYSGSKAPMNSLPEHSMIQAEGLENIELLASNQGLSTNLKNPIERSHNTSLKDSALSANLIQAQPVLSSTVSQTRNPATSSPPESWSNLEDLLEEPQKPKHSPSTQEPWQEQFDLQPQLEAFEQPQTVSETLISPWIEPDSSQPSETLISPLASTETAANSSSTPASKIDDEQFEQLAQIVYRMVRSRFQIDVERERHLNTVHPPWLNTVNTFPTRQRAKNESLDGEMLVDRQFAMLVQKSYYITHSRLRIAQERNGKLY